MLDIETFPKDKFLDVDHLKPGDKVMSSLDVINNGNLLFTYQTIAEFAGGSMKYYDSLKLEIKDGDNKVLYNGSLKDFKGLEPRRLLIYTKDRLKIKVELPAELGNDYQGLSTIVKLTFRAEQDITATSNGRRPLPSTGTDTYNFMMLGLILFISGIGIYIFRKKRFQ